MCHLFVQIVAIHVLFINTHFEMPQCFQFFGVSSLSFDCRRLFAIIISVVCPYRLYKQQDSTLAGATRVARFAQATRVARGARATRVASAARATKVARSTLIARSAKAATIARVCQGYQKLPRAARVARNIRFAMLISSEELRI